MNTLRTKDHLIPVARTDLRTTPRNVRWIVGIAAIQKGFESSVRSRSNMLCRGNVDVG